MMRHSLLLATLALPLAVAMAGNVHAQTSSSGRESVETRGFRNLEAEKAARARAASGGHHHGAGGHAHHAHGGAEHGVETENIFGFTLGSDTEHAGAFGIAVENVGRFGKRDASYSALGQKLELAYGVTNDLSVSLALLGDFHRVKPRDGATTFEQVDSRYMFNGIGGEIRYRFLDRRNNPFGLTLHIEPSLAFSDEVSGLRGRKFGAENKIIFDREIIPERLFASFNLLHEMERMKERGADSTERGTKVGASLALAYQFMPNYLIGAETRYVRAYEGLTMTSYLGDALYVGPTVSARIAEKYWFSLAYNGLVAGREKASGQRLDLANFERHQFRLKFGYEF